MAAQSESNPICCPEFDPIPWDDQTFAWENKQFIKDRVFTLFYIPVNFGSVMKKLDRKVIQAGGSFSGSVCLSDHTSKWNMDLYLEVDKEIPGAENTSLSGKFFSRVYEGAFQNAEKWIKDYHNVARIDGYTVKKLYLWYTTCPKCAKKYGRNYTVIIGQIE